MLNPTDCVIGVDVIVLASGTSGEGGEGRIVEVAPFIAGGGANVLVLFGAGSVTWYDSRTLHTAAAYMAACAALAEVSS